LLRSVTKDLGPGQILWKNDISYRKTDMRFGTWNVRSLYKAVSFMKFSKEISKYVLDLVGVQEVSWDRGCTQPAGEYTRSINSLILFGIRKNIPVSGMSLLFHHFTRRMKYDCSNYRGISLPSTLYKILRVSPYID
jgi:hypothetical protein